MVDKKTKSFEEFKDDLKTQAINEQKNKESGAGNIRGADLAHI